MIVLGKPSVVNAQSSRCGCASDGSYYCYICNGYEYSCDPLAIGEFGVGEDFCSNDFQCCWYVLWEENSPKCTVRTTGEKVEEFHHPLEGSSPLPWSALRHPLEGQLNIVYAGSKIYFFSESPYSLIIENKYIPAEFTYDVIGLYSINVAKASLPIIIEGIYEGPFHWNDWGTLIRVREVLQVKKYWFPFSIPTN